MVFEKSLLVVACICIELHVINCKTETYQVPSRGKAAPHGTQSFAPMTTIAADDVLDNILIDRTIGVTNGVAVSSCFVCYYNLLLVIQSDLEVRDIG